MEATLTFWRPQRSRAAGDPSPKPGESSVWTDIGRLDYRVTLSGPDRGNCPKSAYRESDRNLASPATDPDGGGILPDAALDQPASRANTLTYTVNLSECLRHPAGFGAPPGPLPWASGQTREIRFAGTNLLDNAEQIVYFKRK
jgi:hypothetical protein